VGAKAVVNMHRPQRQRGILFPQQWQVPLVVHRVTLARGGLGVEAHARAARYQAFQDAEDGAIADRPVGPLPRFNASNSVSHWSSWCWAVRWCIA
jgi:hypothetical protein